MFDPALKPGIPEITTGVTISMVLALKLQCIPPIPPLVTLKRFAQEPAWQAANNVIAGNLAAVKEVMAHGNTAN